MFNRRHDLVCITFLTLSLIPIAYIYIVGFKDYSNPPSEQPSPKIVVSQDSYFKDASYFALKKGKKYFSLRAKEIMRSLSSGKNTFFDPSGKLYFDKNKQFNFAAKSGFFDASKGELFLDNNVAILSDSYALKSNKLEYFMNRGEMRLRGSVYSKTWDKHGNLLEVLGDRAISWPEKGRSRYSGNVSGKVERKAAYQRGINFSAKEMSLDANKHHVGLTDDVVIKKQLFTARGRKGEIYLENYTKKLKYFALYDDVRVREYVEQEGRQGHYRRAYAEKLEAVMSEDKVVLTGYPKVYQLADIIKGNRITLRENNEVVEIDDASTDLKLR